MIDALKVIKNPQNAKNSFQLIQLYANQSRNFILLGAVSLCFSVSGTLFVPWITVSLIDNYYVPGNTDGLPLMIGLLAGIIMTVIVSDGVFINIMQKVGQRIIFRMRGDLFNHCQKLPRTYFDKHPSGVTLTRLTADFETFGESIAVGALSVISDVLKTLVLIGMLFYLDFRLALVLLLMLPIVFITLNVVRKKLHTIYVHNRTALAKSVAYLQECLSGVKTIQIYAAEQEAITNYRKKNEAFLKGQKMSNLLESFLFSFVDGFMSVCVVAVIGYAAFGSLTYAVTAGILIGFINSLQKMFVPIREFSQQIASFQRSFAALHHIYKLFSNPVEEAQFKTVFTHHTPFESLIFDRVSFRYSEDGPIILKNISFEISKGQKIALVGVTGSGKSTIIRLISKQYTEYSGSIKINGIELSDINRDDIPYLISVMHQDFYLFHDTIQFNIGLEREKITDQMVIEAAEYVMAHKFIEEMPERYQYILRDQGNNLSAGQRQLIAFARSVASGTEIFVLDEATGKIDTITERFIEQTVNSILAEKTGIVIAHRLSTIQKSDLILVMEQGQIVERGNHEQLLTKNGHYAQLLGNDFSEKILPSTKLNIHSGALLTTIAGNG